MILPCNPRRAIPRALHLHLPSFTLIAACLVACQDVEEERATEEPADPTAISGDEAERLAGLGYADWVDTHVDELELTGVTRRDGSSAPGANLYKSRPRPEALLIDSDGRTLHRWTAPPPPAGSIRDWIHRLRGRGEPLAWHHIEMLDDGSLLGIVKGRYVEKVGLDSTLIWRLMIGAHHDLDVDEDGRVFVLTEHMGSLTRDGVEIPIVDNGIASIAPDGTFLGEVSLLGALGHRIPEGRLEEIRSAGGDVHTEDVLHSNSIEILRRDVEGLGRRGQVLVAVRELDLIAVVDLGSRETVFEFGPGTLDRPHHPSVAPNGNLLVFDNGMSRGFSRVIEVDPKTKQIVWEYRAEPPARFFSYDRGACQSLSNGNVLITESNRGRVFEVTRDGTIVWEFFNPDVNSKERSRAAIYRMERIELQRLARLPLAGSGTSSRADAEVQDPGEG